MTEEKKSKNPDLIPRIVVALIGVPVLLATVFFGPNWLMWLLLTAAGGIGSWEYLRMMLKNDFRLDGVVGVLAVVLQLSAIYWFDDVLWMGAALFVAVVTMSASILMSVRDVEESGRRLASIFGGFLYLTVLVGAYILLFKTVPRSTVFGYQAGWFLLPMFVVWAGDTGAYFVGRAIGKRKLAPVISPGKSWEGAIGGLFFSILGAYVCVQLFPFPDMPLWLVATMAVPAAILGQMGDIFESLIKRSTGTKDSSRILYGHGGMLDRVDALIFAVPWILLAREIWL